jgi:hypothetical protein
LIGGEPKDASSLRLIADIEGILYQLVPFKDETDIQDVKHGGTINFVSLNILTES